MECSLNGEHHKSSFLNMTEMVMSNRIRPKPSSGLWELNGEKKLFGSDLSLYTVNLPWGSDEMAQLHCLTILLRQSLQSAAVLTEDPYWHFSDIGFISPQKGTCWQMCCFDLNDCVLLAKLCYVSTDKHLENLLTQHECFSLKWASRHPKGKFEYQRLFIDKNRTWFLFVTVWPFIAP